MVGDPTCRAAYVPAGYSRRVPAAVETTPRVAPSWFRWSIFPVVLGSAVAATIHLMDAGVAAPRALLGPQLLAIAVVALLEHVYPYHLSWNRPRRDIFVDVRHGFFVAVTVGIATPAVLAGGVAGAAWLSREFGSELWPRDWPLLAQGGLALVVGELPGYAVHRLQHQWDGLWRFHATHHSAPRLYWLNAGRFHVVDTLMTYVPSYGLLVLLGASAEALALFTLVTAVHGIFQHANLQLSLGPLNHFFSMAELHRWHHSKTIEEANHNFGQTVILWDTLFGTRFLPSDREPPEDIGIPGLPSFPMTWWAQVTSPFRWASIKADSQIKAASQLAAD